MSRFLRSMYALALCCVVVPVFGIIGCGPLPYAQPMGNRLNEESQAEVNAGWERALSPVDRLDRQQWLDVMVLTQAFQAGVDRFEFRSEKDIKDGLVVMEVTFDRASPTADQFRIKVYDDQRKLVRQEAYVREEVDQAIIDLYREPHPDNLEAREEFETNIKPRIDLVESLFPKYDELQDESVLGDKGAESNDAESERGANPKEDNKSEAATVRS